MSADPFHGLFRWASDADGRPLLLRHDASSMVVPCPSTGRPLRVGVVEANTLAICPSCASRGHGGFVSFDGDLRMAYACPECSQLVWVQGV